MTHSDTSPAAERNRRGTTTGAGGAATALPIVGAACVLIVPIVLWAVYGNGDPQHTMGVAIGSAILAWAVARRGETRGSAPAPAVAQARLAATPPACRPEACRPAGAGRLSRDVGCSLARDAAESRRVRRRARP